MNQQAGGLPILDSFAPAGSGRSCRLSTVWSSRPNAAVERWPQYQAAWLMFSVAARRVFQFIRCLILPIVQMEQRLSNRIKRMSTILWDVFAGSVPFRSVIPPMSYPFFDTRDLLATANNVLASSDEDHAIAGTEVTGGLGRIYRKGAVILRQGETGEAIFVIQTGSVELVRETDGHELSIAELSAGDFFGETALFEQNVRTVTVRALTEVRLITVDRWLLLRKINQDPSLAFRMMNSMAGRITKLAEQCMYLSRARLETAMLQLEQERNRNGFESNLAAISTGTRLST